MSRRFTPDEDSAPWGDSPAQEWASLAPAVARSEEDAEGSAERTEGSGRHVASGGGRHAAPVGTAGGAASAATGSSASGSGASRSATSDGGAASAREAGDSGEDERAARSERDDRAVDRPGALRVRQTLIAVAVPLASVLLSIRAVATSSFLWFEYHRPGFPGDEYGFSTEDRMVYGSHGLDYVQNFAPARYLGELTLPNGETAFTASEVSHMTDVKHVLMWASLAVTVLCLAALLGAIGLKRRAPGSIRRALFVGGWLTVALVVVCGVLSVIGWESFFTTFHQLFFPGGNWAFFPSDTLIRLYPNQFWLDAALAVGVLTLVAALIVLIASWPSRYRRQRELKAVHERQQTREDLTSTGR